MATYPTGWRPLPITYQALTMGWRVAYLRASCSAHAHTYPAQVRLGNLGRGLASVAWYVANAPHRAKQARAAAHTPATPATPATTRMPKVA
jgi:hypothetical protein